MQALVLGAIQGATALLPISSSAHLFLVPTLLGWKYEGVAFDVALHGTRDAVIAHDHSAQLHAAANAPKELWTVEDAEHVAVFGDPGPWRDRLAHALETAVR